MFSRTVLRHLPLLALLLALPGLSHADSWAPPKLQVVSSTNGRALARVTPGGFSEGKRPEVALYAFDTNAGQYTRTAQFKLRNRLAPVVVLLTGHGELVTLDEWAGVGRGTVLAVYTADGQPRLQFTLDQLLGEQATGKATQSISSTWWRCRKPQLSLDDNLLRVDTYDNGSLRVELATGKVEYEPGNGRCA